MEALSHDIGSSGPYGTAPSNPRVLSHPVSMINHPSKPLCLCTCSFLCLGWASQLLSLAYACSFFIMQPHVNSFKTMTLLLLYCPCLCSNVSFWSHWIVNIWMPNGLPILLSHLLDRDSLKVEVYVWPNSATPATGHSKVFGELWMGGARESLPPRFWAGGPRPKPWPQAWQLYRRLSTRFKVIPKWLPHPQPSYAVTLLFSCSPLPSRGLSANLSTLKGHTLKAKWSLPSGLN